MDNDISQQLAGASDTDLLHGARLCLEKGDAGKLAQIQAELKQRGLYFNGKTGKLERGSQ
jgi:hypothetical protein